MKQRISNPWNLSQEQLEQIFQLEIKLSDELRYATKEGRKMLYIECYERYFNALPFHPQLLIKNNPESIKLKTDFQMKIIEKFINKATVFLEIGAGDCALSERVSNEVSKVFALDASKHITQNTDFPDNLEIIIADCTELPFIENSIDLAYSNQLVEHLHPEDFEEHLTSVYKVLKPNGKYICITPNRITGPNDISRFFTNKNVGFHLQEYTNIEIRKLLIKQGYSKVSFFFFFRGKWKKMPYVFIKTTEKFLLLFKGKLRKKIAGFRLFRILLEINPVATK
jgi:SAM-dependent methyltransferase